MANHYKIISSFYNVEKWIRRTLLSVKHQNYDNFQCVLIDDVSTDNTVNIVKDQIKDDDRFILIENKKKKYSLENISAALNSLEADKDDIVVFLDGDDWFAHGRVLSSLNKVYEEKQCWMTYGSYIEFPSMTKGKFCRQVSNKSIQDQSFRKDPWTTSHLHTFKYGLWQNLDKSYLHENDFVEHHFWGAHDLVLTYPMLEMSGEKSHFIDEVLYVYNRQNPLNVDKVDHNKQLMMESKIRNQSPHPRLVTL
jgi:glycosyltransferase involved in cell wall biosynthesis